MAGVVWKSVQRRYSGIAVGERCGESKCLRWRWVNVLLLLDRK